MVLSKSDFGNIWKALIILVVGFVLTTVFAFYTESSIEARSKSEFSLVCNELTTKMNDRLQAHAQLLRNGSAFFAASDTVTRKEWKTLVEHYKTNEHLPGIQGAGFSFIIPKNQLQNHIQKIRHEGFPDYNIKPAGNRDFYTSVLYLEPFNDSNLRAFGYDLFTEPVRRKAMEQARDFDLAALTDKIIIEQETDSNKQAGVLMFVPVYRNQKSINTLEDRKAAIVGWVFSPYKMNDLMSGALGRWDAPDKSRIHLQIYDNDNISAHSLLFDSQRQNTNHLQNASSRTLTLHLVFNGKMWTLCYSQLSDPFAYYNSKVITALIFGISLSILMFGLFLSLTRTKIKMQILEKLTSELRESEFKFKVLADYTYDWEYWEGLNSQVIYMSASCETITGFNSEAFISDSLLMKKLVHPEDSELYETHYKESHLFVNPQNNNSKELDFRIIKKDGSVVHIGHVCTPVLNDKGHFLGTRISNRDITKRKEAEKELFESEQRYRCLIETANEGIIVAKGRRLVFVNPMMLELTGYSQEEMLANDFLEFVCNEDWDLVLNNQLKRLSGELADPRYQLRIVRKDKSIKWVDMNGVKIEWEGEPATMNFVTDITERKRVEAEIAFKNEELLRLNSEKDKFFSIIAHDLRGPFSGFLGLTQIMANQLADLTMDELQQIAISMKNSATNLSNLLENLLEWSLVHQGLMPFNPKILKLRPIADESISIMQEPAKSKDIEIINNISDDTMVFADSNLLQTVIRNLVSNAVKFTHKGGNIRLYSRTTEERRVEISIHDSGIGISPKMLNQLFRLDSKTNRNGTEGESSSGLGLLLCKGFVEKHGGKLWAESEEGKGSIFYFTIPFKNEMAS